MASIWAVCGVMGLLVVAFAVWTLGSVIVVRHQTEHAADLAALAAAGGAQRGATAACERAAEVADRMQVRLRTCTLEDWDALVVVEAPDSAVLARFDAVTSRARAGPVDA